VLDYQLEIIKKPRKNISFKVKNADTLTLVVPRNFNQQKLPQILDKYKSWIEKNLLKIRQRDTQLQTLTAQESLFSEVFGEIKLITSGKQNRKYLDAKLTPILQELIDLYTAKLEIQNLPIDFKTGVFKTKWGSCQRQKTTTIGFFKLTNLQFKLKFNLAMAFLPLNLIQYVVAHELAHTLQMNHGPKFWQKLESVYPDAKNVSKQLKNYGSFLQLTNLKLR
jgi:predicted metal-dependent hydrolase